MKKQIIILAVIILLASPAFANDPNTMDRPTVYNQVTICSQQVRGGYEVTIKLWVDEDGYFVANESSFIERVTRLYLRDINDRGEKLRQDFMEQIHRTDSLQTLQIEAERVR